MKYAVALLILGLAFAVQAKNMAFVSLNFDMISVKIDDYQVYRKKPRKMIACFALATSLPQWKIAM